MLREMASIKKPRWFASYIGLERRAKRILIVEDDIAYWTFWRCIINRTCPKAIVDCVSSGEAAEDFLKEKYRESHPYDIVILDIFLSGPGTGLDLWSKLSGKAKQFLFVSSMSKKKYEGLVKGTESFPFFLEKPLVVQECTEVIQAILAKPDVGKTKELKLRAL